MVMLLTPTLSPKLWGKSQGTQQKNTILDSQKSRSTDINRPTCYELNIIASFTVIKKIQTGSN